jgi:hypothetical protein
MFHRQSVERLFEFFPYIWYFSSSLRHSRLLVLTARFYC